MKKLIFGLLSVTALSLGLFSCSKQDEAVGIAQEEAMVAPEEFIDENQNKQAITLGQLSGLFELKFYNTASDREWKVPSRGVGPEMFPGTYLSYVSKFNFNPSTKKVALSSTSSLPGYPDTVFGSVSFKLEGENLSILVGSSETHALLKVYSLQGKWLTLEDKRTKKAWAFYKK
jgi:hypothetical protein